MAKGKPTPQRIPDAVRDAVERTIQATVGSAQQTRGRTREAVDEIVRGAEAGAETVRARVREAIDTTRPATYEELRELQAGVARARPPARGDRGAAAGQGEHEVAGHPAQDHRLDQREDGRGPVRCGQSQDGRRIRQGEEVVRLA